MIRMRIYLLLLACLAAGWAPDARSQAVAVTVGLDTNIIAVGETTQLRVYAQVTPTYRTNADRIFSWYVNVLNTNGTVAEANYDAMLKTASDNDPNLSSTGFTTNHDRFGIYDTFTNLPGAGVSNPVELLSIPVTGVSTGLTRLSVSAGGGVPPLSSDFIVAPLGGGDPLTGGDYSLASATLQVTAPALCPVTLHLTVLSNNLMRLTFTPCPNADHTVEYSPTLGSTANWQPLPGGPYNSGSVTVTNTGSQRFFRLLLTPASAVQPFSLAISSTSTPGVLELSYPVSAGHTYSVEYRDSLDLPWQTLPNGPYNGGQVTVTNQGGRRFFRVNVTTP